MVVRTRFATTHNNIGFARKKAQTISLIERGFKRLGLSHKTVGFSRRAYIINIVFVLGIFLLEAGWEALVFGHFSQPLLWIAYFSFYTSMCSLSFVHV